MKSSAYIQGAYQTKFGELWDKSWEDLAEEATLGSLENAKAKLSQIEAIYVGSMLHSWVLGQNNLSGVLSQLLQVNVPIFPVEVACASGGAAFYQASRAVETDQFNQVLVLGVEKMTDVDSSVAAEALMGAASFEEREAGLTFPGLYGLMSRAYQEKYKVTDKDISQIPVVSHQWAAKNPQAHFGFEVSLDQVLQSSLVADPIRLLHCSGVSDGAAAVVISKEKSDVCVAGVGMATDTISLSERESVTELKATQLSAQQAYIQAKISPSKVDIAEVHDCFSIAQVLAVEDSGLAEKGKGCEVAAGKQIPINTSGGLKACGHPVGATGVKQIVELTKQLTGQAGKRQVKGLKVGLAHNVAGSGSAAVVSILTKTVDSKKGKS